MKLYYHPFSSNARKPLVVSALLDIPLELILVDMPKGEHRSPWFLKLNPNGKVPVLVDEEFVLWESAAIVCYLADKKPGNTLYPKEPLARTDVLRWMFWAANHWAPALTILAYENVIKPRIGLGQPDPDQVARGETMIKDLGQLLDNWLANRPWLCGQNMTLADIVITCGMMHQERAKMPLQGFRHLQKWFGQVQTLDAWKKTNPEDWNPNR